MRTLIQKADTPDHGVEAHINVGSNQLPEYSADNTQATYIEARSSGFLGIAIFFAQYFDWRGSSCAKITAMIDGFQILNFCVPRGDHEGKAFSVIKDLFHVFDRRASNEGGTKSHILKRIAFVDPAQAKMADHTERSAYTATERDELGKITVSVTKCKHGHHRNPNPRIESGVGCTRAGVKLSKGLLDEHELDMVACLFDATDETVPLERCSCAPINQGNTIEFEFVYRTRHEMRLDSPQQETDPKTPTQTSPPWLKEPGRYFESPGSYDANMNPDSEAAKQTTPRWLKAGASQALGPFKSPSYDDVKIDHSESEESLPWDREQEYEPASPAAPSMLSNPTRGPAQGITPRQGTELGLGRQSRTPSKSPNQESSRKKRGTLDQPGDIDADYGPLFLNTARVYSPGQGREPETEELGIEGDGRRIRPNDEDVEDGDVEGGDVEDEDDDEEDDDEEDDDEEDDDEEDDDEHDMLQQSQPPVIRHKGDLHQLEWRLKWSEFQMRREATQENTKRERYLRKEVARSRADAKSLITTHQDLLRLAKLSLKRKRHEETSEDGSSDSDDDNDEGFHGESDGPGGKSDKHPKPPGKKARTKNVKDRETH